MKVLRVKNVFTYVDDPPEELDRLLRFRPKGYYFMPRYKSGLWDGYVRFLKRISGSRFYFPSGFIFSNPEWFKSYKIIDEREYPEVKFKDYEIEGVSLRDYQRNSIENAINSTRGVINLATNAGKTEVAIAISKALSNLKVLFITHRQHLLFQTKERFEKRLGEEAGYIGVGDIFKPDARIIIATVQTLYNYCKDSKMSWFRNYLKKFQVVFWDEVHHLSSDSWYNTGKLIPAFYRFGLTATVPDAKDIRYWKLVALTGGIIAEVKQKELVERGISALPDIFMLKVDEKAVGDYKYIYRELIEESEIRNKLLASVSEIFPDRRIVYVVNTIRHGNNLMRYLDEAKFLTGREDIKERLKVIDEFKKGNVKRLVVTTWFEEGTDIPEIEVFVNAAGGLSDRLLIQRMGRALRKKEGRNEVIIIDVFDNGNRYLRRHSKERINTYKEEGFNVRLISNVETIKVIKEKEKIEDDIF